MYKICPNCHTTYDEDEEFCDECDVELVEEYQDEQGALFANMNGVKCLMKIPNVESYVIEEGVLSIDEEALMDCPRLRFLDVAYTVWFSDLACAMEHANSKARCRVRKWPRNARISDELQKEIDEGWTDSEGFVYSQDRKRLLRAPDRFIKKYVIPEGVEHIERLAFLGRAFDTLHVPYTCNIRKDRPILGSSRNRGIILTWNRPYAEADEIEDSMYRLEDADTLITDKDGVRYTQNMKRLISCLDYFNKDEYRVPDGVVTICNFAFVGVRKFLTLSIPRSVKVIGDCIFGKAGGKIVIR